MMVSHETQDPKQSTQKEVPSSGNALVEQEINDLLKNVPSVANTFHVKDKIGSGTFSSVYTASLKACPHLEEQFALKHIIPTSNPSRIESELKCLQQLGGADNVMGVNACVRNRDHVVIVMPYFPHDKFADYVRDMNVSEMREYMYNLLLALRRVHTLDIIHRDIKPSNFLVNRKQKRYALVDFGLAQKAPAPLNKNKVEKTAATSTRTSNKENMALSAATVSGGDISKSANANEDQIKANIDKPKAKDVVDNISTKTPLPPSKATRRSSVELSISPRRKRKLLQEDIDMKLAESPSKRLQTDSKPQATTSEHVEQAMANMTLAGSSTLNPNISPSSHVSSHNELFNSTAPRSTKSPRRMLLTRRTMIRSGAKVPRTVKNGSITTKDAAAKREALMRAPVGSYPVRPTTGSTSGGLAREGQRRTVVVGAGAGVYTSVKDVTGLCGCFKQPTVCTYCLARSSQSAPRAGTPGFRAPEVLMKYPHQTTAVDIWSAGVIMLCIMSGRYPFFKAGDDLTALAQIISIMGTDKMKQAANAIGKELMCSPVLQAVNLRQMTLRLRNIKPTATTLAVCSTATSYPSKRKQDWSNCPSSAYHLLYHLLELNPHKRITAEQALNHPFFKDFSPEKSDS